VSNEEIISKTNRIIVEHLGVEEEKVVRDADFADDLGADSLDMVELTMAFEEEFGIEISDHEAEKVDNVGSAYDLLTARLAK
jgi:acyl carrier protein